MSRTIGRFLIFLGVFCLAGPFVAEYWDEDDEKLYLHGYLLKMLFNVGLFALVGITLFTTPLMAEYSSDEAKQHYEEGLTYLGKGYPDLAAREMEEAVRLEPKVVEGHKHLASAYTLRFALAKAVKEYEAIFTANPEVSEVPGIKALWVEEHEDVLHTLKKELKQLHETKSESPMVHIILGWLYGEEGKLKDAYKELLHAREEDSFMEEDNLGIEDRPIATLLVELATAMQNSPHMVKTQLDLLLFAIKR
jgi:tetratricopeptide (TPR) repeat protein